MPRKPTSQKRKSKPTPLHVWWDFRHNEDESIDIGIECADESLTFDGHYLCIIPPRQGESTEQHIVRVERIIRLISLKG